MHYDPHVLDSASWLVQEVERLAAEVRARDSTLAEARAALDAERRQTDELERQLLMQVRR